MPRPYSGQQFDDGRIQVNARPVDMMGGRNFYGSQWGEMKINWMKLLSFIFMAELVGIIGSFGVSDNLDWFNGLNRPSYAPSGMVIGLVWIVLYALMGISLYLITEKCGNWFCTNDPVRSNLCILWFLQLGLNFIWTPLFFMFHQVSLALVVFALLLVVIVIYILDTYKINKWASLLFMPYLAWGLIAISLNYQILMTN